MVKVIINVFGSPTAGKSTIITLLQKHIDRLYTVDFDVVKHQISNYSWKRDSAVAQELTYDTLAAVTRTGLQIAVLLPKPKNQNDYERIVKIAGNSGYRLLNIELTAPEEILVKRYEDRLRQITNTELKSRMKNIDEFITYVRTPYYLPDDTHSFDSSVNRPDAIFDDIIKLI